MKAFPGAYGWGAESIGGRGGTVIEVVNTNDSGAGSFREALEASGPRIVVFRTGGIITLSNTIYIDNPYLTIAGQTAPGGGVTIKGARIQLRTHNMIIRYLSWRGGAISFIFANPGQPFQSVHDIIIDHCSMSWGEDDIISIYKSADQAVPDIYNFTIQNCLIAEPHKDHPTSIAITSELGGYDATDEIHHISIHHNLFVHSSHRNPRVGAKHTEVINNVVYNWSDSAARLGGSNRVAEVDWINNYFLDGPMTGDLALKHNTEASSIGSIYINGNIAPNKGYTTDDVDNWGMYVDYDAGTPLPTIHRRYNRLEPAPFPVPIQSAIDAYASVLANVGANARLNFEGGWVANIDETDARLLADVAAGIGPSNPGDIIVPGTIGDIDVGMAYTDTDSDGMPDDWENLRGLDPDDDTDGPVILSNGYSNVEVFLNGVDPTSEVHVYLGLENINLSSGQRATLLGELESLGPASNPQPARSNHWRIIDSDTVVFESLFSEKNLTITKFKARLGAIFSVDPGDIGHVISNTDYAGYGTPSIVFSYDGTDYLRIILFGEIGTEWMESGDECRGYL